MTRARHLTAAAGLALVAAGCGDGSKRVEGSLSELLDLRYQSVTLGVQDTTVALRFVEPQGSGENVVLEVTGNFEGVGLTENVALKLEERLPSGAQRGVVTRNVFNDPRKTFPELERGKLTVATLPGDPGTKVRGSFTVTFVAGTEFGSGRTAFADFEAKVP
jgi:hypothetical protein